MEWRWSVTAIEVETEKDRQGKGGGRIQDIIIKVDQKYPMAKDATKYFRDCDLVSIAMVKFSYT